MYFFARRLFSGFRNREHMNASVLAFQRAPLSCDRQASEDMSFHWLVCFRLNYFLLHKQEHSCQDILSTHLYSCCRDGEQEQHQWFRIATRGRFIDPSAVISFPDTLDIYQVSSRQPFEDSLIPNIGGFIGASVE